MDKKLRQLETFRAVANDGTTYVVRGYEHLARVDEASIDPEAAWQSTGVAEYKLDTGEPVEIQRDGRLRAVRSGLELRPL